LLGVTRILAFGDSMTEGTTSPEVTLFWRLSLDAGLSSSYPYKLQALCAARYTDQTIQVFNGGRGGMRAADDRDRFNEALSDAEPEVVLLMEGANDMNQEASITSTVNAMEDMVRDAQGRGLTVMLATIPLQRPGGPKAFNPGAIPRYNDALRTMAARKAAILVDVGAQLPMSLIGQDGLHPTDAGYDFIAGLFLDALKLRYERAPEGLSASAASTTR
jgi:lysophospholipase L1-like esterase